MQAAQACLSRGEWAAAARELELAAGIHARESRSYDQARCLQLAATLRRSSGATEQARALLEQAAAVAPQDRPLGVSIAAERAETALQEGRYEDSVAVWSEAIGLAGTAGLRPDGMSALLRRRASARIALGQTREAHADYDEAARLLEGEHGPATACFALTEEAGLLLQYDHRREAEEILQIAEERAPSDDWHLRAEILVLRARLARLANDYADAAARADRARAAALEAVAPVSYFGACVELAAALGAQGETVQAYGALATAWGTLSDVLGREAASAWVEPVLAAYRMAWGEERFAEAKTAYETRRRAERGTP